MWLLRMPPTATCTTPHYLVRVADDRVVVVPVMAQARQFNEPRDLAEFVSAHAPLLDGWAPVRTT